MHLQQFHLLAAGFGAKDQADGRFFPRLSFVFVQPLHVKLHLAFVRGLEAAQLEFYRHQTPQAAVIEQQVEIEVFAVDHHAFLPLDEGKAAAQLQNERLQLT